MFSWHGQGKLVLLLLIFSVVFLLFSSFSFDLTPVRPFRQIVAVPPPQYVEGKAYFYTWVIFVLCILIVYKYCKKLISLSTIINVAIHYNAYHIGVPEGLKYIELAVDRWRGLSLGTSLSPRIFNKHSATRIMPSVCAVWVNCMSSYVLRPPDGGNPSGTKKIRM